MKVDAYASQPHYAAHLAPTWLALPAEIRGTFHCSPALRHWLPAHGVDATLGKLDHRSDQPVLVASAADSRKAGSRPTILQDHGAGQTYGLDHPSYAGGPGHDRTILFLCPGEAVCARWEARYPSARVEGIGCPRLDLLHQRGPRKTGPGGPVVGVTFHWDFDSGVPETRSAWPHYRGRRSTADLLDLLLSYGYQVLGSAHPRCAAHLARWYAEHGVEFEADPDRLLERIDVLIADNTSLQVEALSVGLPVVFLDSPDWRPHVWHGNRFYRWPQAGSTAGQSSQVPDAIRRAIDGENSQNRTSVVAETYAHTDGHAAQRAVDAIIRTLEEAPVDSTRADAKAAS